MKTLLLVGLGGAIGACGRHIVGAAALRALGPGWPAGTLTANTLGGLAMGLLVGWLVAAAPPQAASLRAFLAVGVLGGFTTFSAFTLELVSMVERKAYASAVAYAAGSVLLASLAMVVGLSVARALMSGDGS